MTEEQKQLLKKAVQEDGWDDFFFDDDPKTGYLQLRKYVGSQVHLRSFSAKSADHAIEAYFRIREVGGTQYEDVTQ